MCALADQACLTGAAFGELPASDTEQVPAVSAARRGLFQRRRLNDFRGKRQCDASELWTAMVATICDAESAAGGASSISPFRRSFLEEYVLGCAVLQRRYCAGCGWVSDLYRRELFMTIQMLTMITCQITQEIYFIIKKTIVVIRIL